MKIPFLETVIFILSLAASAQAAQLCEVKAMVSSLIPEKEIIATIVVPKFFGGTKKVKVPATIVDVASLHYNQIEDFMSACPDTRLKASDIIAALDSVKLLFSNITYSREGCLAAAPATYVEKWDCTEKITRRSVLEFEVTYAVAMSLQSIDISKMISVTQVEPTKYDFDRQDVSVKRYDLRQVAAAIRSGLYGLMSF